MKYSVTKWTVKKLKDIYDKQELELAPAYQRNFIWSISDQRYLIESVRLGNPIPNFFLLKTTKGFEMVDGQQRSRTIMSFLNGDFKDEDGEFYTKKKYPNLLNYEFPVTIITDVAGQSIEQFYAIVNKTGIHLNKPEVRKAEYYDTRMLQLVKDISDSNKFKSLKLFSETTLKRMNDTEFVAELVVLTTKGHVDKKNHLDEYFEKDISTDEVGKIKNNFNIVLDRVSLLNRKHALAKTRYKQRNDFYTLFDFIFNHQDLAIETLYDFYQLLIAIDEDIRPSQDDCVPLRDYARNCVTQSNSKDARQARLQFFEKLLLNTSAKFNSTQKAIATFYGLAASDSKNVNGFLIPDPDKIIA